MNIEYVLGFVFDLYTKKVLLMKKKRPEWQIGSFNGIGGKYELDDESIYAAIVRECKEETSAETHILDWRNFCTMRGLNCPDGDWTVHCLSLYLTNPDMRHSFTTNEDELVVWFDLDHIQVMLPKLLGNIPWLIGMALDHRVNGNFEPPVIEYSGGFSLPLNLNNKLSL
jgi:8-oxo-dGTP pyrophosphatase MutT (NUDIX family)